MRTVRDFLCFMFSILKGGDGGDCLIMPEFCHLSSDSEGRRPDGMPSLCCAVVQCPDDAISLDVGAHAVGHRRNAKGSGCGRVPLEFCEHGIHLVGVYIVRQPGDAVACDVLTELVNVTLRPLAVTEVLVFFGVAVDHLIVADPKSDVPGGVVCPSVHAVSCVVWYVRILVGQRSMSVADVPGRPLSTWLKSCSDTLATFGLC